MTTTKPTNNQQLLPLYTEWTNRQLTRVAHRPVSDLSTELRDYRVVAAVAQAVLSDPQRISSFRQALATVNSNIEGLNVCLGHLQQVGVNCSRITATDIDAGQLGSVLQLLYSLHNFKQNSREKKPPPSPSMPPAAATRLPTVPQQQRSSRLQPPTSRIATPTKTAIPTAGAAGSPFRQAPPSPSPKTSALRPPSSIRPPSGNNNGSVTGSPTYATLAPSSAKPPVRKTQLQPPKTNLAQPKMLKMKLFGSKEATKEVPKKAENKKVESALRQPSQTRTSRLAPPTKTPVSIPSVPLRVQPTTTSPDKRTSKSSEEDSAYAGFGSTSPASSTQSSISLRSASSKGSREHMSEPDDSLKTVQEKPVLAVRALGMSPPAPLPSPKKEKLPPSPSPAKSEKIEPTVGVVSPIVQRKSVTIDCKPSSSKPEEKTKPAVPVRKDSRLETTKSDDYVPPSMAPSLPTYSQLLREGRIQSSRTEGRFDSSTSEDSLDSVTTTIRLKPTAGGCCSEGNTLDRPGMRARSTEPSGYTSESGMAIYQKMQERMRECRESFRRAQFEYGDSFEDSSSLSSGISDNFEDVSTDDLSGPDHPMAKVAAANASSSCDYQSFTRSGIKGPRSSSSSIDRRARRIAEQENLHALLQQCRTSQRGAGTLRTPFSPQLVLSAEAEALRSRSRSSNEQTSLSGYHSLDRKTQLAELYGPGWQDRAAMALVSPRRVPQQRPSVSASLNAGGMSRSLVLLESPSPRPQRRRDSPRSRGRLPLSVASPAKGSNSSRDGYGTYGEMQLHRLADDGRSKDPMGSQLSLSSSSAYATLNDKYEAEIKKMSRELDGYRMTIHKLSRKHDDYTSLMEVFNQKLSNLSRHVEKAQLKPDEVGKLRVEIDNLRSMSGRVAQGGEGRKAVEGAGELLRQPSLESVASMASHRSSMSSSSKSSKADKASLNSFGSKSKKSWASNVDVQIRSSFTKAFSKKKSKSGQPDTEGSPMHLQTISGSNSKLDEMEVDQLKRQLEDREVALTDVRLDAMDRAREVDLLRETVNRLKTENKQLKQDMTRLLATRSRASSQASLAMHDEEPFYEIPPAASSSTPSSKRSSECNSVKVTVNVDLRGVISSEICPEHEIIIGFLPMPTPQSTWGEIDQQISALFDNYIGRVDADRHLGLHCNDSVIGYQVGSTVRRKSVEAPSALPAEVISPTTTVRLFLRGAGQNCVDSLVLETLFPSSMLEQLLKFLLNHRRLVLSGATGIGKSNIAQKLAAYLACRLGQNQDIVHDIKIPENDDREIVLVEEILEKLLKGTKNAVILLDNVPRNRIAFISSVFSSVQLPNNAGPYVICTVNRACNLPEMQISHNFKMFLLTNRMDGVKGFMGRYLRRRIIEAENRLGAQSPAELLRVIEFLPEVLQAVNNFIEKANSLDVTIGPRIFLLLPMGVDDSRDWFVKLWNENIVPYMVRVAREGVKVLGRCGTFEDPTEIVCDKWPWTEGPSGEELLQRLSIKDVAQTTKQSFNPLDTLIRLQANRTTAVDRI